MRLFDRNRLEIAPFHPRFFGFDGAVTAEHYLAAHAGADILKGGGNAVDAAVAAALVEGVVNPHQHTIGGECPMIIQMAAAAPVVINGNTCAPEKATVENFQARGYDQVPDTGVLAAGVPAAVGAYVEALARFGTLTFSEVCSSALKLAREGFPIHRGILYMPDFGLLENLGQIRQHWPSTAAVYLPDNALPAPGQRIVNSALSDCLSTLIAAETAAGGSRERGIAAVREEFYSGDIASEIAMHSAQRDGFIERSDLECYATWIEKPVWIDFGDARIFKCGPWNQGPALLQTLSILKNYPLRAWGHNTADYLHAVIEAVKLAFADREQWYADPSQVEVPIERLLSDSYGKMRSQLISAEAVISEVCPGDPLAGAARLSAQQCLGGRSWGHGTVHVDAADRHGNMVAATPSGGWLKSSELVKALGVPLGNRLMTFYLTPDHHPNRIASGKRPRTTISPTLVHRNNEPWMVYGSMGGDQQDQWMLQFILNRLAFDMTVPEAIEAAKFSSRHFPGFFAPHENFLNQVSIEEKVGESVFEQLRAKGHVVNPVPDWTQGYLLAIERDPQTGLLEAGCDPRGAKGDVFPAAAVCW